MKNDSLFKRQSNHQNELQFIWQGQPLTAQDGDTIASALLAAGIRSTRQSPVSGSPRAPFCMMGSCFECMVEVDEQIIQACMEPVTEGLNVKAPLLEDLQ